MQTLFAAVGYCTPIKYGDSEILHITATEIAKALEATRPLLFMPKDTPQTGPILEKSPTTSEVPAMTAAEPYKDSKLIKWAVTHETSRSDMPAPTPPSEDKPTPEPQMGTKIWCPKCGFHWVMP